MVHMEQVIINRAAVNPQKNPNEARNRQMLGGVLTANRLRYS